MTRYSADAFCWSGLASANRYSWQEGCRFIAAQIGGVHFIPSKKTGSGYDHVDAIYKAILASGHKHVFLMGHSNGNVATTLLAMRLKKHGIQCTILCLDRTMKRCEKLGSNVPLAMDLWAGPPMKRLVLGEDFRGELIQHDFRPLGHISMTHDEEVLRLGSEFGKAWRKRNPVS